MTRQIEKEIELEKREAQLEVVNADLVPYGVALETQLGLAGERRIGAIPDTLILLEHPSVVTVGKRTAKEDILVPEPQLQARGVEIHSIGRGGQATYHGPGQLVGYIIAHLYAHHRQVKRFVRNIEEVLIRMLNQRYHVPAVRDPAHTGVWVGESKIAAVGIQISEKVTMHGFALNVNVDLEGFSWIVPCGIRDRGVTSMQELLGEPVSMDEVKRWVTDTFVDVFGYRHVSTRKWHSTGDAGAPERKPSWLRVPIKAGGKSRSTQKILRSCGLHTVCEEANCPNRMECFESRTATFLILGDTCTRRCTFCNVRKDVLAPPDPMEPGCLADAVEALELKHVVITSVTRDDLPDGGAAHFAACVAAARERVPGITIEVLIPDFLGDAAALAVVLDSRPDVLNHNVETVPRLYPRIRPGAGYSRSLQLLARAKQSGHKELLTKSGLMVGLGERSDEIHDVMRDLRQAGCDLLTIGQYLAPSQKHAPIHEYVTPAVFDEYRRLAGGLGFRGVASAPLVRSSYQAAAMLAGTTGGGNHAACDHID